MSNLIMQDITAKVRVQTTSGFSMDTVIIETVYVDKYEPPKIKITPLLKAKASKAISERHNFLCADFVSFYYGGG